MPTRTSSHQREVTRFKSHEQQLYTREGLDRSQIRYEFSNSENLDLSDRYIEDPDHLRLDHQTVDLAEGPTGIGETGGAGVSFIVEQGDRMPTTRYARGFPVNKEEVDAGVDSVAEQRDAVIELFDFEHDIRFLTGHRNHVGDWIPGIFEWLDENIPSDRVLDASSVTYDGVEENLIKHDAFSQVSNRLMSVDNPVWGSIVGRKPALINFHQVQDGSSDRSTYWDRINTDDSSGVGINNMKYMPDELVFDRTVEGQDPVSVSLVDGNSQWTGLGSDEVYLLPPMENVREAYWKLYESASPELDGPYQKEGGRRRFDYIDRFALDYDPLGEHSNVTDAVKITNVSSLFA